MLHLGLRADTRSVHITIASTALPGNWLALTADCDGHGLLRGCWRVMDGYALTLVSEYRR